MKKLLILLAFFCLKVDGQVLNIFPDEPVSAWHPGSVLNLFGNYSDTIFYSDTTSYCFTGDGNNYAIVRDNDILSMQNSVNTDTSFYVSFWTYLSDVNTGYFAKSYEYGMWYVASSNLFYFRIWSQNTSTTRIGMASTVLTAYINTWINVIVTYNGSGLSAGIKIYVNNIDKTGNTSQNGTYVKMINTTANLTIGYLDETYKFMNSLYDFRIGKGILTSENRLTLMSHEVVGNEFLMLPCSEGYGQVLHNVASTNMVLAGEITTDVNLVSWSNSQFSWYYNKIYGAMKINDYVFPNYIDKTYMVRNIKTIIIAGQSNAGEPGSVSDIVGYDTVFLNPQNKSYKFVITGYFINVNYSTATTVGVVPIIGYKYDSLDTEIAMINYYSGTTLLYDSSGHLTFNIHRDSRFPIMQTAVDNALLKMFYLGRLPEVQSFVWSQGETDAAYLASANAYQNNLQEFVDSIRSYWYPFNIDICQLSINQTYAYKSTVRAAQNYVSTNNEYIHLLPSENWPLQAIPPHYSYAGVKNEAIDIFENTYNRTEDVEWYLDKLFPFGWTIKYCKPE
jgi:hypothetical protein